MLPNVHCTITKLTKKMKKRKKKTEQNTITTTTNSYFIFGLFFFICKCFSLNVAIISIQSMILWISFPFSFNFIQRSSLQHFRQHHQKCVWLNYITWWTATTTIDLDERHHRQQINWNALWTHTKINTNSH